MSRSPIRQEEITLTLPFYRISHTMVLQCRKLGTITIGRGRALRLWQQRLVGKMWNSRCRRTTALTSILTPTRSSPPRLPASDAWCWEQLRYFLQSLCNSTCCLIILNRRGFSPGYEFVYLSKMSDDNNTVTVGFSYYVSSWFHSVSIGVQLPLTYTQPSCLRVSGFQSVQNQWWIVGKIKITLR